jgi:plasmid stabilization system protein ParE
MSRFRNFSRQAAADLDHIIGWTLDHGSAGSAAERLLKTVLAAGERLATRPLLGRHRPDLLPEPFRFWSIPRHRLVLVYDPTTIPPTILSDLRWTQGNDWALPLPSGTVADTT